MKDPSPRPDRSPPAPDGLPSVRLAGGFVAGILLVQQLSELPGIGVTILAPVLLAVAARFRWWVVAAALAGMLWAGGYGALRLAESLPTERRLEAVVEGRVLGLPEPMDRGVRFDFGIERTLEPAAARLPRQVRVSWYEAAAAPRAGETWQLRLSLRRPRGLRNPGGFDYEEWLFAEGIRAVGYVRAGPDNRRLAEAAWYVPGRWRQGLSDGLDRVLAGSPMAGLVKALTLGAEDDISRDQWEVLRRTGTAHLVAISGSHIGLIAAVAFFLARAGWSRSGVLRWPPPAVAAWIAGATALAYSALAGFAIPTQRALIMIAVAMGAVILQRTLAPAHGMALALLAVTLYDPLAVLAPGFWLSFGAVALIAYVLAGRTVRPGAGGALLRINWATAVGLAPLLLVFFRQVSLVSPLANLLAVPVLGTLLIPLCLLGALLLPVIPAAGAALVHLAEMILAGFWPVLEWLSALPAAQWTHAEPPAWTLAPALIGVLLLLAPRGIPARWLGLVLLLPALTYQPERPAPGAFRLVLLDVGQGLAAVVETRHRNLVFDTGARLGPNFDMGSAVVEPYLRHRGLARIDTLVVSHGDNDHVGGARSLLERFPVGRLMTGAPEALAGFTAETCGAGDQWTWDGVNFRILGPLVHSERDNDNSCVLMIAGSGGSVLLTGDIEAEAERRLVAAHGAGLRSTLLVAPHHGSKSSSTREFLAAVGPDQVLIPAGHLNRFGFPHPATLRRYAERAILPLDTATAGAIVVRFDPPPAGLRVESYREAARRYWNEP